MNVSSSIIGLPPSIRMVWEALLRGQNTSWQTGRIFQRPLSTSVSLTKPHQQGAPIAACITSSAQLTNKSLSYKPFSDYSSKQTIPHLSEVATDVRQRKRILSDTPEPAKEKMQPSPSPNAFVSVRIASPSIRQGLEVVQKAMVEKDEAVQSVLTSLDKLHITLSVVCIEGKVEQERAKIALLKAAQQLNKALGFHKHPLSLTVSGLSSFGERVVYADIVEKEMLQKVSNIVQTVFREDGFPDVGGQSSFNPHLTIAKMSLAHRRGGRGGGGGGGGGRRGRGRRRELKGLGEELYADFKTMDFGIEKVISIELLSMVHPPAEDHYYHCFQRHSFQELGEEKEQADNVLAH